MTDQAHVWHLYQDDPRVVAALRKRQAYYVMLVDCPHCYSQVYYNWGSRASCPHCHARWRMVTEDELETGIPPGLYMLVENAYTVRDAREAQKAEAAP